MGRSCDIKTTLIKEKLNLTVRIKVEGAINPFLQSEFHLRLAPPLRKVSNVQSFFSSITLRGRRKWEILLGERDFLWVDGNLRRSVFDH